MNNFAARRAEVIFLLLLTLIAFGLRLYRVGTISLAEDEAGKWLAIQQYKQGHFVGVNPEHPMLMKLLAWASFEEGKQWNRWAGDHRWLRVREEAILRMPNIVVGALTTIVIYLLGKEMLGVVGAGATAFFWAFTPLPIALNRILKEDTLATFFTYLALYLFWRGKKTTDDAPARRLFTWSGISFGLAVASKYYFHFIALNFLIWHIAGRAGLDHRPFFKPFAKRFWLAMALAFVLFNPAILWPTETLDMYRYLTERTLQHHGYNLNGHLYMNDIASTPFGVPWYFYAWAIGVKTPLPVLVTMAAGLVLVLWERRSLNSIFLRVMVFFCFVPFSLVGAKWIRYLLDMLPFLFLLSGCAVGKLYEWFTRLDSVTVRRLGMALAALVLLVWPAAETVAWVPSYPLYLNQLGGGRANVAKFFPHDELYDLGVREAVQYICRTVPGGAVLAVSNPMAVGYYLEQCGRADVQVRALFDPKYGMRPGDFLLLQESRRYFETEDLFREVRDHGPPLKEVTVAGLVTARIYRF
jgi:hypothetical protein